MAKKKITVKEAINVLNTKYANTLGMLDDALDQIEHLENELAKKPKEVHVEVEKVVEVERKVEVPKEVVVTREVEVPGPERVVEVPGPERVVEVPVEVVKEVPVEVVKEVEVIKEVEVPVEKVVEKIVEKEVKVEVPVEKIVEKEITKVVPGPERVVVRTDNREIERLTAEVEKLEKKLKVKPKEIEKIVEVPVEKIVEVPVEVEVVREIEKIVEGPRRPKVIEKDATGDLLGAATLIANSELNVNDLSTDEVLTMLKELSEEDVNKQLGFWAIPLPKDGDQEDSDNKPRYLKK